MRLGEKDLGAKKEGEDHIPLMSTSSAPSASSKGTKWSSSFKNPRIVRVSRNFGGKDRHSKVCTVRGLRDRRIRLSVPTAIQLYDLQDRLGLTQPSKVVDWLLDAANQEIDKLPPLPMIPTNLLQFHEYHHPSVMHEAASSSPKYTGNNVSDIHHQFLSRERWNINNIAGSSPSSSSHSQHQEGFGAQHNFFPLNSQLQFSVPDMPYTSNYFQPNLSLSQFGGGYNNSLSNRRDDQEQTDQAYAFPPNYEEHFRQMNDDMQQQNSVMMPLPTTLHLINHSTPTGDQQLQKNNTTS